jgi:hypothetical protein
LRSICVFCGSSHGNRPDYTASAQALGRTLARRGLTLVYGGGNVGLMGELANAAMDGGGQVVGVIPEALMKLEVGHRNVTSLEVVGTMHERKARMAELADAFIALPGGIGTLEELFEVWTWAQLGLHGKPLGFLDVGGYYDHLHRFLDHTVAEGFLKDRHRAMVEVEQDAETLLDKLAAYLPPETIKLMDVSKT